MRHPEHMKTRGSIPTFHRRCPSYVPRWVTLLVVIMLSIGSAVAAYAKGSDITAPFPFVNQIQGKEFAVTSAVDSNGNVIVAGYQTLPGSSYYDFYTVKFKSDGSGVAWQVPFGSAAITEQVSAMVIDGEGNVIVTGTVLNASDRDIVTVKYDGSNGAMLWKSVYQGTGDGSGNDYATAVAVDASNNVYVAGYSLVNRKYDYLVLKYNKTNSPTVDAIPVLVTTYNNPTTRQDHKANAIAVGSDGSFVVTGDSSNGTDYDSLTVKFNQSGGVVWEKRIASPYTKSDSGRYVRIDSAGNVIVTGYVFNITDSDMFTIKYLPSGALVWDARYNSGFRDEPSALAVDADKNVYVTGFSHGHRYTVKYGVDAKPGTQEPVVLWEHFNDSGLDTSDVPTGIAVDETTDGVFVTGYIQSDGGTLPDYDVLTAKYNKTTGHLLWQKSSRDSFNTAEQALFLDGQPLGLGMPQLASNEVSVGGWTIRPLEMGSAEATVDLRTTTIKDPTKNWTTSLTGKYIKITSGPDAGVKRGITASSDNTLTVEPALPNPVATGDKFFVFDPADLDFFAMKYDKGLLDPPTNLQAKTLPLLNGTTVIGVKIQLTWENNSPNATGFKIERCKGKTCSDFQPFDTVNQQGVSGIVTYDDLSEKEAETYYNYQVKAYLGDDASYFCTPAHALTHYVAYPAPTATYTYNNTVSNNSDEAKAIVVGPDNNPIVTGSTYTPDGGTDYLTMKLSKDNLAPIWTQRYTSSYIQGDIPTCLTVDSNGQAIVSGYSYQPAGLDNADTFALYTIKYLFNPAPPPEADVTRIRQWAKSFHGPAGVDDRATAIASSLDADNNLVVVGYGMSGTFAQNGQQNIYVLKYLADGTLDWQATPYDKGGDDVPTNATFDAAGNVFVVGYSEKGYMNGDYNLFVAKYCGTAIGTQCNGKTKGQMIWSDLYDGPGLAHVDAKGYGIAVDKSGDVYVTGYAVNAAGNKDLITIKYQGTPPSNTPVKLWSGGGSSFDGLANGDDVGVSVKVDPVDGNIMVAGTTLTDTYDHDFLIIRYDAATGAEIWKKTLQREQSDDTLTSMAMDYSGNVYLVGTTIKGESSDILSVVYDYSGKIVGASQYNSPYNLNDGADSVAVNTVGDAFIAGYSLNAGVPASSIDAHLDYLVIKQTIDLTKIIMAPGPFKAEPQPDYTKIKLTWSTNTPGSSVRITRLRDNSTIEFGPDTHEYIDTVSIPNTRYDYSIVAFIDTVNSRLLSTGTTTTMDKPVFNPINLTGGVTQTTINLTWPAVSNSTAFRLERSTDNINWTQIPATGDLLGTATSYLDTPLIQGRRYYYRLTVKTLSGYSLPSIVRDAATIPAVPGLKAPTSFSSTEIRLAWDPSVEGATSFVLEYHVALAGTNTWTPWVCVGKNIDGTTGNCSAIAGNVLLYNHTGLLPGTKYGYRIKSINASGESPYTTADLSTTTVLTLPQIATVNYVANTSTIRLTWNDPNSINPAYSPNGNEDKFKIYYQLCNQTYPNICDAAYDNYPTNSQTANWGTALVVDNVLKDTTTTDVINLSRGRTYRFWIVAVRNSIENNDVTISNKRGGTVSLPALTKLRAPLFNDTWINFAWDDINGNYNYKIFCKAGTGPYTEISTNLTPDSTAFSWLSATPLTAYTCYHTASNDFETVSSILDPLTINTMGGRPSMISVAALGQTSMYVKWNTIAGTTGWQVWRNTWNTPSTTPPATGDAGWSTTWTNLQPTTPLTPAAIDFTDNTAVAGNFYRYKVTYRLADNTTWSAYSDPPLWAASWPAAPASLSVTGSDYLNTVLTWGNVDAETGYIQEQKLRTAATCAAEGTDWTGGANTISRNTGANVLTTTYTNTTTPTNREIYCYHVKAVNGTGGSGSSPWSTVVTKLRPPITFSLSNIAQSITINWSDDTTENTGYRLEYAVGGSTTWNLLVNLGPDVTTYTHSGLVAGQRYDYRVRTLSDNSAGVSEPTPALFAHTTPSVPTTLAAAASPNTITLTWDTGVVIGETGYLLQYRKRPTSPPVAVTCTPADTTTFWGDATVVTRDLPLASSGTYILNAPTDIIATPATVYCFRVSSYATNTNLVPPPPTIYSAYGTAIQKATLLAAPNSLYVEFDTDITATSIKLTWEAVADNFGYRIQRSTSSDFTANLVTNDTIGTSATTFTDIGLSPATTYYYRIYAKNLIGDYSLTPRGTSALTLTLAPPSFAATAISPLQIDLSWKTVFGQTANVLYRTGGSTMIKLITNGYLTDYCGSPYPIVGCTTLGAATITYKNTGLVPDTNYCYYVTAQNANTLESLPSPTICLKTPKIAPAVTVEAADSLTMNVSWSYPGPNEGFEIEAQLWNGSWVNLATVPNATLCSDTSKCSFADKNGVIDPPYTDKNGVERNRIYKYRVRAYLGTDKSAYGEGSTMAGPYSKPFCPDPPPAP